MTPKIDFTDISKLLEKLPPLREDVACMSPGMFDRLQEAITAPTETSEIAQYCGVKIESYPVGTVMTNTATGEHFTISDDEVFMASRDFKPLGRL